MGNFRAMVVLTGRGLSALLVGLVAACSFTSSYAATTGDFEGNWVVRAHCRALMSLTLHRDGGSGNLVGVFRRPAKMSLSVGPIISNPSGSPTKLAVKSSRFENDRLFVDIENRRDPKKVDTYILTKLGHDGLLMEIQGAPVGLFPLMRSNSGIDLAQDWAPDISVRPDTPFASNEDLKKIFDEDQALRTGQDSKDWKQIAKSDKVRRQAVMKLLQEGDLKTGQDYERAAIIYQHGETSDDFLMSHSLALAALSKGAPSAVWIATASMDRYLEFIGRPQIYGTQSVVQASPAPDTVAPLPQALRKDLALPESRP
ncbi:putative protein OS=Sphingobium scionense OX=1404341 GN=GGQ90_001866 PE=4 SV=1 [Sphingobium scionense]